MDDNAVRGPRAQMTNKATSTNKQTNKQIYTDIKMQITNTYIWLTFRQILKANNYHMTSFSDFLIICSSESNLNLKINPVWAKGFYVNVISKIDNFI